PDRLVGRRAEADELLVDRMDGPAERRLPEGHDDLVIGDVDDDVVRMEPPEARRRGSHAGFGALDRIGHRRLGAMVGATSSATFSATPAGPRPGTAGPADTAPVRATGRRDLPARPSGAGAAVCRRS